MKDDEEKISESSLLNQKQFSENINNITYVIKLGIINNDKYPNSIYLNCTPKEILSYNIIKKINREIE